MASVKAVLRKKKNESDGTYPLAIRITKDRKSSYIYLGHQLKLSQWDEVKGRVRKHPNATRLNNLIIQRLAEVNSDLIDDQTAKKGTSAKAIKQKVAGVVKGTSFFSYADNDYLKNLKDSGSYTRYSADAPRVKRFREFLSGGDIGFQNITVPLIRRFGAYLKRTRNISDRTVINHYIVIRTIYNQAIQAGLVEQTYYPFGKAGIQIKFPDSVKIGLSREEVALLEEADLTGLPAQDHARNLWLISFYFAGMRVSDVLRLKWSDFQNGRLFYTMGKNDKAGSIKVSTKAQEILLIYKDKGYAHDLVFPELESVIDLKDKFLRQKKTASVVGSIDKALKRLASTVGVEKKLTMHIARHTFGNLSGDRIPIQMLQKLYRHSDVTTTINYQSNFIFKDTDDALEKVIGE